MPNELIGVGFAIVLTIFLFVLRRLVLPSERANTRRHVANESSPIIPQLKVDTDDDADRVLWTPDFETKAQRRSRSHEDYAH